LSFSLDVYCHGLSKVFIFSCNGLGAPLGSTPICIWVITLHWSMHSLFWTTMRHLDQIPQSIRQRQKMAQSASLFWVWLVWPGALPRPAPMWQMLWLRTKAEQHATLTKSVWYVSHIVLIALSLFSIGCYLFAKHLFTSSQWWELRLGGGGGFIIILELRGQI